ncbi:odv-e66 [Leucania separata nucleopolyhedrovirus]|uniref:Odv-e66 n=1 Tax=Leucania separata nucleopolyhedrovirus TaxID=1307956 RepID=Q0IL06_NPVLS|nr:odv-e66 [Leucania separata nucleopolyhedrovirus]AAR28877.1 odv-e66 [Leucania separata nucleopolyhedrovirus]
MMIAIIIGIVIVAIIIVIVFAFSSGDSSDDTMLVFNNNRQFNTFNRVSPRLRRLMEHRSRINRDYVRLQQQQQYAIAANELGALYGNDGYAGSDLYQFEKYYLDTLQTKFLQKAEKIMNPTRLFSNDGNIFEGLDTWNSAVHFGTALHTLIGYGVRFRNPDDSLYLNGNLAENLMTGVMLIYNHLPFPAPINQAPWGNRTDWYHFSITMPECVQNTCIVLRGFYNLDPIVERILAFYLPQPTFSMGWRRTAGNAMRMCLPYAYGQLLRGFTSAQIKYETEVQYVLDLIRFHLVASGNGIHYDYTYFDHTDVRAYGYLINSFFTFDYYNYLFGEDTVNMLNVRNAINLVGSNQGNINPALISRSGSNHSAVLGHFMTYTNGSFAADFSKILTYRTDRFFGSVVGNTDRVAYYEADENNNLHAPLWAMTRRIWASDGRTVQYRAGMLGIESGIILNQSLLGAVTVPTTGPSTSSFMPTFAYTAICTTDNAGVMIMHARFEELHLEFHSYTLYHKHGMIQLYDKIKALNTMTSNARCVVLTRDLTQNTNEPQWVSSSNAKTFNRVTALHYNIANNPSLSNFSLRNLDSIQMQSLEQIVSMDNMNKGTGVVCYGLVHADSVEHDSTVIVRVDNPPVIVNNIIKSTIESNGSRSAFTIQTNNGSVMCAIDFPYVVLKDVDSRQVTINNATNASRESHRIAFSSVSHLVTQLSLNIHSLKSSTVNRNGDAFYFDDVHGNQFRFTY